MKSVRRVIGASAVAAALVTALGATGIPAPTPEAHAETGVGVNDVCAGAASDESLRINLLVLLDTSGSLRENDPDNLRSEGTREALRVVESLSRQFGDTGVDFDLDIEVALDTFDERYFRQEGWLPANDVHTRLGDTIVDVATADGIFTNYVEALTGARSRFATRAGDCNLLIWFTDGEHATAADDEGEQQELLELCSSPEMQSLREHVWVGAVQLNTGDTESSQLRFLYGDDKLSGTALECLNPLRGRVYDDFEPARLHTVLRELIERLIPPPPERVVPDPILPDPEDFEPCTGGDGSSERPCLVQFELDSGIESFRAFVDLTYLERRIENPDSVLVAVQSPDGKQSPSIGDGGDIKPGEQSGEYLPVQPFWFYTRSLYPSDLQIIGHQAAEQLVDLGQWRWQWEGQWTLLFFGDTPEAQADARKAAAAVRFQSESSPAADSLGIGDDCTLRGFVLDFPPGDYSNVELRVRVDRADGTPVYPTRLSLTDAPLEVRGTERSFELPGIFDQLFAWDSPDNGGNGRNLREAIDAGGGLTTVAVLSQQFNYGGWPEPLRWERDIGRLALTDQQLDHIEGMLAGEAGDPLLCDPGEEQIGLLLPTDLTLSGLQDSWDGASFEVSAVPGVLPATLSLNSEGAEIISEGAAAGTAPFATAGFDQLEWSCDVPAASEAGDSRFTCPDRISVPVSSELPVRPTLHLRFPLGVAEQPGSVDALLQDRGYEPDSEAYRLRHRVLDDALAPERRSETLEGALDPRIDPNTRWLPSNLELGSQPSLDPDGADDDTTMHMRVTARPAELPAELSLRDVVLTQSSSDGSDDAEEVIEAAEVGPWSCAVPAATGEGRRFRCPEPITVELPAERDAGLSLIPTVCTKEQPESVEEFLARFGLQPGSGDFQQLEGLISEALSDERSCGRVVEPVLPSPGDTLREFWPMLAVLTAVALAARVGIAWRLRPWSPIDSAEYATLTFPDDGLDVAAGLSSERREVCMDLRSSNVSTQIEGVRLRSRWLPLLLGRAPALTASSQSGHCIGPKGCKPQRRRGSCTGLIGPDLARGWIVESAPGQRRLIVWDLPMDSDDAHSRIADSARDAAPFLEQHLESHHAAVPGPDTGTGPAAPAEASPSLPGQDGPDASDPFAADEGPAQTWAPQDDSDPFGRDNKE